MPCVYVSVPHKSQEITQEGKDMKYFWGHGKSDPVVMYEWATRSQKVLKEEYNVNNIEFNSYAGKFSLCFERVSSHRYHRSTAQRLTTRTQGPRNLPEQGHSRQIVMAPLEDPNCTFTLLHYPCSKTYKATWHSLRQSIPQQLVDPSLPILAGF